MPGVGGRAGCTRLGQVLEGGLYQTRPGVEDRAGCTRLGQVLDIGLAKPD